MASPNVMAGRGARPEIVNLALWRWWQLAASGTEADLTEIEVVYDEIIRRIDELDPALADRLRHAWEVEWFKETGCCPRCRVSGERHS